MKNRIKLSFELEAAGWTARLLGAAARPEVWIGAVVAIGLILRLMFFVGFAGGDPQDDGIYLNTAKTILQHGAYNHNIQKDRIEKNQTVNPFYIFPSRVLFTNATALSMRILGVSDFAVGFFPLLCSLLSIVVVYKICGLLFDRRTGVLAGALLALMPLDILYATRITPDVPVGFFIMLSIYFFLKGRRRGSGLWLYAAGLAVGLGYLVKSTTLVALVCMAVWVLADALRQRKIPWRCAWILPGFLTVYVCEGMYYAVTTDYFFLRTVLISKVYKIKYAEEWKGFAVLHDWGWLLFKYPADTLLQQIRTLANLHYRSPELRYFGIFYYPVFFALAGLLIKPVARRWLIISWFALLFAFVELGPLEIGFGLKPLLTYGLIEKQPRYLTVLTGPAVVLTAVFLMSLAARRRRQAVCVVLAALTLNAFTCAGSAQRYFRDHTRDLREAARLLEGLPPKTVYADWLAMDQIYFYSGFTLQGLRDITGLARSPDSPHGDSYVVLGGARGVGVIARAFEERYRRLARRPPAGWIPVKTFAGEKDVFRNKDLTIYYIPR